MFSRRGRAIDEEPRSCIEWPQGGLSATQAAPGPCARPVWRRQRATATVARKAERPEPGLSLSEPEASKRPQRSVAVEQSGLGPTTARTSMGGRARQKCPEPMLRTSRGTHSEPGGAVAAACQSEP